MLQNNRTTSKHIWCAIPVYNNRDTVRDIAAGCRSVMENVLVVDDGSIDGDIESILSGLDVVILKHEENRGKGRAILTASAYIEEQGGTHMITIDADGQHNPADLEKFIPLLTENGMSIIVGNRNFDTENVPGKSRFGRKFANFWLRLETGVHIDDCQSGFRAYPVSVLNKLRFFGSHYDFEAEVLAKAAWAGIDLKTVEIDVFYPEGKKRVSSFRPFLDNLRISVVHTMLILRQLLPFGHKRLVEKQKADFKALRHPGKFLKMLLKENASPAGLAMAAAVGIFLAVLPLIFVHTAVILYVATRLNLNKIVALNVQHICAPPFVPALCIEVGYYIRHGQWLTNISFETVFSQFSARLIEWLLGSLIIAPAGAVLAGAATFFSAQAIQKKLSAPRTDRVERKRGNALGFWFFRTLIKMFGLSGAYALLYPVCLYYLLIDRAAVAAGMAYVRRRFRTHNKPRRIIAVYRLFISQGKSLIDRYYASARPGKIEMELKGYNRIKNLLDDSRMGMILLTAHVGNWQIAMTALRRLGKKVYLLMSAEENAAVKHTLNIDDEDEMVKIISPDEYLGGVVEIIKVIDEGNIVSIMGDRSYGHNSVEAVFLGEKINLPNSAFTIAAAVKCPVVILLSFKESRNKYVIDISHIINPRYRSGQSKEEEIRACVQKFADILEDYSSGHPFQWFVFRDIWDREAR